MLLKTPPAFAICSSNNVLNLFAVPAHHQSMSSPFRRHTLDRSQPQRRSTKRCYATANNLQDDDANHGGQGCPAWPTCANPTPYDIFAIDKSAAYTKARFALLVKQYHPDKHHYTPLDALSSQTRLERYRLVVLANDILSSPEKRRAYDSWGAGWHTPGTDGHDDRDIHEVQRQAYRAWRHSPNNPGMNATWEDWERWHERNNGEKQQPVYMSNASFAALVLAALAIGTLAQTTRMDNNSAIVMEQRQAHEANVRDALRRQGAAVAGKGREERIERFLRERENLNYDFAPARLDARHGSDTK